MSGVKKEKPRLKYAVELSRHIQGFGLYLTLAILCNLMFKLLPLATSLVTSYMVSSVLLGEASQVIRLLAACGMLVILLSLFSYLDVQVSHDMAYRILTKLRDQCYAKLDELAPAALIDRQLCMNYILKTIKRVICRFQRAYGSLQLSLDCPPTLLESFWINGHFRSRVRLHEKFFILTAAPLTCYNWKGNGEWRIVDSSLTCFSPCCTSTFTPRLRWQTRWVYNCGRCDTTLRTLIVRKAHLRLLCWKRRCI